jgi:MerR family copper efflux transcriptional regulator
MRRMRRNSSTAHCLAEHHEFQIVPPGDAKSGLVIGERQGLAGERIAATQIPGDQGLAHDVLPKTGRGENGYREYPETAVKLLKLIDEAQRLGFSLSEIRSGLGEAAPYLPSHAAMVKALRAKLDMIDQHLKDVRARCRQIVRLLEELEG